MDVKSADRSMVHFESRVIHAMSRDAESTTEECCGLLFGYDTTDYRRIVEVRHVPNVAIDKQQHFEISPLEIMNAERYAETNNLILVGVYHSHPNQPAVPSAKDRAAAWPSFSYVILSVINRRIAAIRSWQLIADRFTEEHILI